MKARVTNFLNLRFDTPSILPNNNPNDIYFRPGDIIEIAEKVRGDLYKNNDVWYRLQTGGYVWSGAVEKNVLEREKTDYRKTVTNIPTEWMASEGRNVKVAILDTGFNIDHPDLNHLTNKCVIKDFGRNTNNTEDTNGHGTFLLGLLAADTSLQNGVIGLAPKASYFLYKVFRERSSGFLDFIVAPAIIEAVNQEVDIINMSFNVNTVENSPFHKAITTAADKNIIIVASAGEDTDLIKSNLIHPAEFGEVTSVGEVSSDFAKTISTSLNKKLDFLMPYVNQRSCSTDLQPDKLYRSDKGSSMASALITGALASILSTKGKHSDPLSELRRVSRPFKNSVITDETLQIIIP